MASPALSFPFAHWPPPPLRPSLTSSVTCSAVFSSHLLAGLASGELLAFAFPPAPDEPLRLRARLTGHEAPIVCLSPYTVVSENSTSEHLLLSLSSDGSLSKWSLRDFRCLQSAHAVASATFQPRGMVVIKSAGVGEGDLTDDLILVYGCSTDIAVLNAQSLETVLLWTGHVDWPIPAVLEKGGADKTCTVVVITPAGQVQGWTLAGNGGKSNVTVLNATVKTDFVAELGESHGNGIVKAFEKTADGYVVVRERALAFYMLARSLQPEFLCRGKIRVEEGIVRAVISSDGQSVYVQCVSGDVRIFSVGTGQIKESGSIQPPFISEDRILSVASAIHSGGEDASVVFFTQSRKAKDYGSGSNVSIASLILGEIQWSRKGVHFLWEWAAATNNPQVLASPAEPGEPSTPHSSCSATFLYMFAVAQGCAVRFYSIPAFLTSYQEPTATANIACGDSRICLLKCVRIGEYAGNVKSNSGALQGGSEYLIVGTISGEVFIVSPTFQPSQRLSLFPSPPVYAHVLPADLGRRLRSTVLISSVDGTAAVIDVERARIMVTFPSHDYSPLASFAVICNRDVVALTYQDGARREWDMGKENGGVLKHPPPSHSSDDMSTYSSEEGEWQPVEVPQTGNYARRRRSSVDMRDVRIADCKELCKNGLPTASVNVRFVLATLEDAISRAMKKSRVNERRVLDNNPAVLNAKALLTALIPGGPDQLLPQDEGDFEEYRHALGICFFHRKQPATLGQIGAGGRISMLSPSYASSKAVSPTVTTIVLLTALVILTELLEAIGQKDLITGLVEKILRARVGKQEVVLGVFAKFWSDSHSVIRRVSRQSLEVFMSGLSPEERKGLVSYWDRFLPIHVPPELFSTKEVVRSIIILGKLITDYESEYEESLKKNVALSAELLLGGSDELYQDTAMEVIGYSWMSFQTYFDPYEVIHNLIRMYARPKTTFSESRRQTLHRCVLEIADKNAPLLVTALANNISHGTPSSAPTASLAVTTLQNLAETSIAGMRIVTMVVREDAMLFRDVLSLIVDAVVKILDPNGGLRERVLSAVTELVDRMVEAYPTIAFHRPTQRLALSAAPGIVTIHDLKSCTTAHVLEGHHHLATSLVFSPDGKYIAAVDADENRMFCWRFPTGLLSFIGGATDAEGKPVMAKSSHEFANRRGVGMVGVEWIKDRTVKVTAGEDVGTFDV